MTMTEGSKKLLVDAIRTLVTVATSILSVIVFIWIFGKDVGTAQTNNAEDHKKVEYLMTTVGEIREFVAAQKAMNESQKQINENLYDLLREVRNERRR